VRRWQWRSDNMKCLQNMWLRQTEQTGGFLPVDQLVEFTELLCGGISQSAVAEMMRAWAFGGALGNADFGLTELRACVAGTFNSIPDRKQSYNLFHLPGRQWVNFGKDNATKATNDMDVDDRVVGIAESWASLTRETGGFITQSQLLVFLRDIASKVLAPIAPNKTDKNAEKTEDIPVVFEHFQKLLVAIGYPLPRPFVRLCWLIISSQINPSEGDDKNVRIWPCGVIPYNRFIKKWLKQSLLSRYCTRTVFLKMLWRMKLGIKYAGMKEMWADLQKGPITFLLLDNRQGPAYPVSVPLGMDLSSHDLTKGAFVRFEHLFNNGTAFAKLLSTGLWPLALSTVMKNLKIAIPQEKLDEVLTKFKPNRYGLYKHTDVVRILRQFSFSGMSYELLKKLMQKMNIGIHEKSLRRTFELMDINKDQVLDKDEFLAGIQILFKKLLPDVIMRMAGLEMDQIMMALVEVGALLSILFAFLLLAFQGFVGVGGGLGSVVQSLLAAFAALWTKTSYSRDAAEVKQMIEHLVLRVLNLSPNQVEMQPEKAEASASDSKAGPAKAAAGASSADAVVTGVRVKSIAYDTSDLKPARQSGGALHGLEILEFTVLESQVQLPLRIFPVTARNSKFNFTVSPKLPYGLSVDNGTGHIVGVATAPAEPRTYTITASAPGLGSASTRLSFVVRQSKMMPGQFNYRSGNVEAPECSNGHEMVYDIPGYNHYGCDGQPRGIARQHGRQCRGGGTGKRWICRECGEDYCGGCFPAPAGSVLHDGEDLDEQRMAPERLPTLIPGYSFVFSLDPSKEECDQYFSTPYIDIDPDTGTLMGKVPTDFTYMFRTYILDSIRRADQKRYLSRTGQVSVCLRLKRTLPDGKEVLSKGVCRCRLHFSGGRATGRD